MPRHARLDALSPFVRNLRLAASTMSWSGGGSAGRSGPIGRTARPSGAKWARTPGRPGTISAWALLPNHAHLLLRSGPPGLPRFMRRLLTGYALTDNRRHHRVGHLFQNRYQSMTSRIIGSHSVARLGGTL